jgi:hypothetical protein
MTWYAAHVVMVVKYDRGTQKRFPVWENILLIRAASEEQAFEKAEAAGRGAAGNDDGSFRWQGRPARWEFAGVRKIVTCATENQRPADGDELTYNELEFDSQLAVNAFARGLAASARFDDPLPVEPSKVKRKRA